MLSKKKYNHLEYAYIQKQTNHKMCSDNILASEAWVDK